MGKITQDELHSSLNTKINKLDDFSEDADGNLLYKNKTIASDSITNEIYKEIANLNLQLQASQRVPNGYTFGTDFLNTFGMAIDYTKTTAVGALAVGTTTIPVQDVTGFKAGQEVTIYDDTNIERVTISGIDPDNKILSVSALTKSYKDGANIARTMAVADTINKCLKFGSWSTQTTNTVTDSTVVASAYDTSGNGGRKLVRLSNGWLVAAVFNLSDTNFVRGIRFYVNKMDGNGFSYLTVYEHDTGGGVPYFAIQAKGTRIYGIYGVQLESTLKAFNFDATTVSSSRQTDYTIIDTGQTAMGNVSLAINSAGTELHAAWASKNSTYPNSFNIRYCKGTINADGSVTWGAVQRITTWNTSVAYAQNPSIVIKDNVPIIFTEWYNGSTYYIFALKQSGLSTSADSYCTWTRQSVYSVGSYAQSYPSACVAPNGRIWVAWHGSDSTDNAKVNIRVAYSDDNGVTWSTMQKLTSGNTYYNQYPSITTNKNNEVFILWYGTDSSDSYLDIKMIKYSNGSWGSISIVSAGTTGHKQYPSTLYEPTLDFSTPLFIYQDLQGNKVGFYGTWTAGSTVPLLENDIRFTVKDTDEVVAWAERDELAGFTINAKLNGQAMTKTSVSGEDQFTASLPSIQPAELRLTMTRANVNDDVKITKILGGVA